MIKILTTSEYQAMQNELCNLRQKNFDLTISCDCKDEKIKKLNRELEEGFQKMKSELESLRKIKDMNEEILYYDQIRMKEIKSLFNKIPNEILDILGEFLLVYKYLFVKEGMKYTQSMEDIKLREGGLQVIENIRGFYLKNKRDEVVERY